MKKKIELEDKLMELDLSMSNFIDIVNPFIEKTLLTEELTPDKDGYIELTREQAIAHHLSNIRNILMVVSLSLKNHSLSESLSSVCAVEFVQHQLRSGEDVDGSVVDVMLEMMKDIKDDRVEG